MRLLTVVLTLAFCTAFLLAPSAGVGAQDGNKATVSTSMVMTALDSLDGHGTIDYWFEGAPAQDLREAIIQNYDWSHDLTINPNEALGFLRDLGDDLENRTYWGVTIQNPTNYSHVTDERVVNMTSGLVGTHKASTESIEFSYDFDVSGEGSSRLMRLSEMSAQTLIGSVERVAEYTFEGTLEVKDRVTLFGISSYTSPDLTDGKLSEFRTPLGSVMWYSFTAEVGSTEDIVGDSLTFESFNWLENQQISFVVLLIGCVLIMRIPPKRFEKYMLEHPKKFRKSAKPLPSVRAFSWAMVILLTVVYLLPFLFSFVDRNLLMYSSYLYVMVPSAIAGTYFITRGMYARASQRIPEDVVIEVKQAYVGPEVSQDLRCQICMMPMDPAVDMYECTCGFTMHNACAHRSQTCPMCGAVLFPEQTRSVECRSCGETFLTSVEEDPFALQCTKCGAFQEEVKAGNNYLVIDVDGKRAYNMIRSMGLTGRPALVLTSEFPGKVREEHGLGEDFEVKSLSETTGDIDSVDIKNLEGDAMETASTFLMTTKKSGLLMDGIAAVISANTFEDALAFVKMVNDLAKVHGGSVILWFDRNALPESQGKALSDEFDEVHDYL